MLADVCVMAHSGQAACGARAYQRSPAVIALDESPYLGIRRVRCTIHDGIALLEGRLTSYHQKQLAQEIVRRAEGVRQVDNHIVVEDADARCVGG